MTDQDTMTNVKGAAAVGGATGGILGALISFIMSTIPQEIPVIGPTVGQGVIATVVVGILAGVGLGALAGALFGAFVPTRPRSLTRERVQASEIESPVHEHEPVLALLEALEDSAPDELLESAAPEADDVSLVDTTTQEAQPVEQELEGPMEIEAEVAAAEEAAIASPDVAPDSDAPSHVSRTRRARRVAPKYPLPESKQE